MFSENNNTEGVYTSQSTGAPNNSVTNSKPRKTPKKPKPKTLEEERQQFLEFLNSDEARNVGNSTIYRYKVKDKNGKLITGTFNAASVIEVNSFLTNEGYTVYNIETGGMINLLHGNSSFFKRKMSTKDLIFWLTQLTTYIKSGIPLTDSVRIIAKQIKKRDPNKKVYDSIVYELNMGESFSRALEKQGGVFPPLLINMLRASEATGELSETLDDMVAYYTETDKTKKQIVSAMTYPAIVSIFSLGVITFIMLYVVPQFVDVYDSIGADLPGITVAILAISNFFTGNLIFMFLALISIIFGLIFTYKNVKAFRRTMQTALMRLPIIGKIIIHNEITIISKTFASLLKNSVQITDSFDLLSKVTNNEIYKEVIHKTIENISKGDKISDAFKDHWAVPELTYHMLVTGESTGELPTMMTSISDYFNEMNRNSINALKSIIEPVMIVTLAAIVGVVILAVIMPMFSLYDNIGL